MRQIFFVLFSLVTSSLALGQKKPLDYAASRSWPYLRPLAISNDGRYVAYELDTGGAGSCLVVEALDRQWKLIFANFKKCNFTADSRMLVFINKHDSLGLLDLDLKAVRYFDSVKSFQLAPGNSSWLGFMSKKRDGDLCLLNLQTGNENRFCGVETYLFNPEGNVLLLKIKKESDSARRKLLAWVNLIEDTLFTVSKFFESGDLTFNEKGDEIAFVETDSTCGGLSNVLKLYKPGLDSAFTVINSSVKGMNDWVVEYGKVTFGKGGDEVYFSVRKRESAISDFDSYKGQVKINNYKAEHLNSIFGNEGEAVVRLSDHGYRVNVVRHDGDQTDLNNDKLMVNADENYALVVTTPFYQPNVKVQNEWHRRDLCLVSIGNGSRRLIKRNAILEGINFSPTGKYIIWYDQENREWDIYCVKDGHMVNISKAISEPLYGERGKLSDISRSEGLVGWRQNDSSVLINGRFDLWEVDPDGVRAPINVTAAFGVRYHVRFRVVNFGPNAGFLRDTMLLSAFDVLTKDNGFYQVVLGRDNSLLKLAMGKYMYGYPDRYQIELGGGAPDIEDHPLKAAHANTYLIQRMSTNEYPNLFITTDFRIFRPLTHLEPQKKYNWYSTELIRFLLPNGRKSEGILFKPENFDPHKKYPVIFYYYERNADALNIFLHANLSDGNLNISWFVSNGYLVFVPDIIYYKTGSPGECAYQAVNAAAGALTRFPWVDNERMGLQGLSFGAWETNYIITHSQRFKAAASGSGSADEVSLYGQFDVGYKWYFISGQGRLGVSLWQNPGVYIRNSPIFRANKVNTPLLIMHTVNDSRVSLWQALEFYRALASLQKKVWLLQYENEDHLLEDARNRLDYSMRLAQFFNYYLKDELPAKWMTSSTLFNSANVELELDHTGAKP